MKPLVHLVVCGAPPAGAITEFITILQGRGWDVCVIPTATALEWLDTGAVEQLTGCTVQVQGRMPAEPKRLAKADLVIVAPATFNTINKWALGINDTPSLGVLNEALGSGVPIVVSPYVKESLAAHPAFSKSLEALSACGVELTATEALRPIDASEPFRWQCILEAIPHRLKIVSP